MWFLLHLNVLPYIKTCENEMRHNTDFLFTCDLVSAGIVNFFSVSGTVLCSGFRMRKMLATQ